MNNNYNNFFRIRVAHRTKKWPLLLSKIPISTFLALAYIPTKSRSIRSLSSPVAWTYAWASKSRFNDRKLKLEDPIAVKIVFLDASQSPFACHVHPLLVYSWSSICELRAVTSRRKRRDRWEYASGMNRDTPFELKKPFDYGQNIKYTCGEPVMIVTGEDDVWMISV